MAVDFKGYFGYITHNKRILDDSFDCKNLGWFFVRAKSFGRKNTEKGIIWLDRRDQKRRSWCINTSGGLAPWLQFVVVWFRSSRSRRRLCGSVAAVPSTIAGGHSENHGHQSHVKQKEISEFPVQHHLGTSMFIDDYVVLGSNVKKEYHTHNN